MVTGPASYQRLIVLQNRHTGLLLRSAFGKRLASHPVPCIVAPHRIHSVTIL